MPEKPDAGLPPTRSPALDACVEDEVLEWYRMTPQERWAGRPAFCTAQRSLAGTQTSSTWTLPEGIEIDTLSLPDLVASKKTQRDKDWPMVRRLLEVSYEEGFASPTPEQIRFWLREIRTPEVLLEAVARHPGLAELEALRRGRQE